MSFIGSYIEKEPEIHTRLLKIIVQHLTRLIIEGEKSLKCFFLLSSTKQEFTMHASNNNYFNLYLFLRKEVLTPKKIKKSKLKYQKLVSQSLLAWGRSLLNHWHPGIESKVAWELLLHRIYLCAFSRGKSRNGTYPQRRHTQSRYNLSCSGSVHKCSPRWRHNWHTCQL